jgi:uncharacterized protein YndB with AHSA1/START domain
MNSKIFGLLLIAVLLSLPANAQENYWKKEATNKSTVNYDNLKDNSYHINSLNLEAFKNDLSSATLRGEASRRTGVVMLFPNEKGGLERFRVQEITIFGDDLAAKYPNIKAYLGHGIDTKGARVRFSVSSHGLQSMTTYPNNSRVFTVPTSRARTGEYITYQNESRIAPEKKFQCLTEFAQASNVNVNSTRDADDQILRTFRIAISATAEYTSFWNDGDNSNGSGSDDALAQIVSTLNRNNEVFEVDMAITFVLVSGVEIVFRNAATDPYSPGGFNSQVQATLDSEIGPNNYDIGHLFHFGGNSGNAGCIGCVCESNKGSAFSSHSFQDNDGGAYMSDFFDIDYVPHEIGHQMGANHTWAFGSEGTGVNVEPGSGTTIMGYAGITGANDVQDHSDPYFHYHSIRQILDNVASSPNNCWSSTTIINNPPNADAGSDYTIPQGTGFVLRGSATDVDASDVLTYTWEQIDDGVTEDFQFGPTKTTGPLWRSRPPSESPNRYMPILPRIVSQELTETNPVETVDNTSWETVSTVSRELNFALTVRDRSEAGGVGQFPQTSFDLMRVTVDGTAGPFQLTSQNDNENWERGSAQTVTWDVAGTDGGNINTANVRVLLSTDGGLTFPIVLADNVPNNGSATFMLDNSTPLTTEARVMVEAVGNIFLAVNSVNFTIIEGTASVDEFGLEGFQLYPNPNNGEFTMKFNSSNENVNMYIFDLAGRVIHTKNYNNVSGFFDEDITLPNMATGIYLLRVVNGLKFTTQKIVIE